MPHDIMTIGATPCEEPCAQMGEPDYTVRAYAECRRFKGLIMKKFGRPPEGALIRIKEFAYDGGDGSYFEVVIDFDARDEKALDYAFLVESESPSTWEGFEVCMRVGCYAERQYDVYCLKHSPWHENIL